MHVHAISNYPRIFHPMSYAHASISHTSCFFTSDCHSSSSACSISWPRIYGYFIERASEKVSIWASWVSLGSSPDLEWLQFPRSLNPAPFYFTPIIITHYGTASIDKIKGIIGEWYRSQYMRLEVSPRLGFSELTCHRSSKQNWLQFLGFYLRSDPTLSADGTFGGQFTKVGGVNSLWVGRWLRISN